MYYITITFYMYYITYYVSLLLLLFFSFTLISAIQLNTEKNHLKEVIKQKEDPRSWDYIAPQRRGGAHFGVFPVRGRKILTRSEIKIIYSEAGVPITPKLASDGEKYWLFTLGEPIPAPDDLKNLKAGGLVGLDNF